MTARSYRSPGSPTVALAGGVLLLSACEVEPPPLQTDTMPAEARTIDTPAYFVPKALGAQGEPAFDPDGLRFRDQIHVMHAIAEVGALSRDSELGHEDFRPDLAEEPMRARGELWLDLIDHLQETFEEDGAWSPHVVETPEGWVAAGTPVLADYAQGVYTYQTHHRSGRWAQHGLEDDMIHRPAFFTTAPGTYLLGEHYEDGRFFADPERMSYDHESMANGVASLHAHIYAWVRREKPGGQDDHGEIDEERMLTWMEYGPQDLVEVARELDSTLDDAWDPDLGAYSFGEDAGQEVTYSIESVGALLRGKQALVDVLYIFGDDPDEERAQRLFTRGMEMLQPRLGLTEPWGLPAQVNYTADGVEPGDEAVDVGSTWSFVHHLVGGYSYTREQDETAQFLRTEAPELLEEIGRRTDTLLEGALEHQLQDGTVVATLDYETGETLERGPTAEAVSFFILGAGNAYGLGDAFSSPDDWDGGDVEERSRALYTALAEHGDLLQESFLLEGRP